MTDNTPLSSKLISAPFPGSLTAGWNDPPTVEYNANRDSRRSRLSLSKRVAFPLQGSTATNFDTVITKPTAVVSPSQTIPPSSVSTLYPVAVVHPMLGSHTESANLPNDALVYALNILREQAKNITESVNVRQKEIERRLESIEKLWQAKSLSGPVQTKIYQLAHAISKSDYNEAMDKYTSLVTNHSNECSHWVIALRHVVLAMQPVMCDNVQENFVTENISPVVNTTN